MKKSVNMLVVSLLLVISILTACNQKNDSGPTADAPKSSLQATNTNVEPLGKYDPPISISFGLGRTDNVNFPEGQTPEDNVWTRIYDKELGIKVNLKYSLGWSQMADKLNVLIASKDLPDVFSIPGPLTSTLDELIASDSLEDLTQVYEQYASPLTKQILTPEMLNFVKRDGKLYTIPQLIDPTENANMMWIRSDWLKKLNLPEPKTMADVEAIATAFKTQDPDENGKADTYGIVATNDMAMTLDGFFNSYHAYPDMWIKGDNGQLVNGTILPEMKTTLRKLQEYYKNGILSKDFITNDGTLSEKDIASGKVGITYGLWWYPIWPLQETIDNNPKADWKMFPILSADSTSALGKKVLVMPQNYYVERKGVEHPEALIKLVNMTLDKYFGKNVMIDPPNSNLFNVSAFYTEPFEKNLNYYRDVNDSLTTKDTSKLAPLAKNYYDRVLKYQNGDNKEWNMARTYGEGGSLGILDYNAKNKLYMDDQFYGSPTRSMVMKKAVLDKLYQETAIKIITGADVNTYDDFIAKWKDIGGDDITKEVNDWYVKRSGQ